MERTKWIERTFSFDFPIGILSSILERLRGTPIRIEAMIKQLSEKELIHQPNGKWSIKEEVGHLNDLEELHEGRIDDFLARKEILRAADMDNIKTKQANHNSTPIHVLLQAFINNRRRFVERLEKLDDASYQFKSLHPRLKVMMRPVDMAYFTAEHDDHHLATIREILRHLEKN
jgi:hypothetical protein